MSATHGNHILFLITNKELTEIINKCSSLSQVFDKLNLCKTGYQLRVLKERISKTNIDISHFKDIPRPPRVKKDISFYLVIDSNISTSNLKQKLFKNKLLTPLCSECGLGEMWNGKPISLQLDHINGVRKDNRIENLRILCPNCHTQTETYSGKNRQFPEKQTFLCDCGNSKHSESVSKCKSCFAERGSSICWPSLEMLSLLVWEMPLRHLCVYYQCSDNNIKKYCKKHHISLPPQGYWKKIKYQSTFEETNFSNR